MKIEALQKGAFFIVKYPGFLFSCDLLTVKLIGGKINPYICIHQFIFYDGS